MCNVQYASSTSHLDSVELSLSSDIFRSPPASKVVLALAVRVKVESKPCPPDIDIHGNREKKLSEDQIR